MRIVTRGSVRLRPWKLALGSSIAAIAAATASPASARCTPDPTVQFGVTTCAGVDNDGLQVPTTDTRVEVQAGATVLPGSAAAAITTNASFSTITVNGRVDGRGVAGLTDRRQYRAG